MATSDSGRSVSTPVPWLSGPLLVAFVVFSIHARLSYEPVVRDGMAALDAASEYFLAHPYLEPGPALTTRLDETAVERARDEFERRRVADDRVPTPAGVMHRQQFELDQQVETTLASVRALPARGIAVIPADGPARSWLVYAFLHLSNWHLIGNGLLLLFFGVYLERSFGRVAYGGLVAFATLAGAAMWTFAAAGEAKHGLIGSTPLVAGLASAFAVRFAPQRGDGFYLAGLVVSALWLLLPPYATASWSFTGIELIASGPPTAPTQIYWACFGAAAAGGLASAVAWFAGIDGLQRAGGSSPVTRDPRFRRAMRAREAGRPREALELLSEYLAADPDAYEAALAAWEVASELGRDAEVIASILRVIRIELRRELTAAAIDHWLDLAGSGIPEKVDPSLLIHMALLLREHDHKPEAVHALRCALERSDERENHVIAARIARAARGLDPGVTETAAWRALGSIELSLSERQALENLIAEVLASAGGRAAPAYRAKGGPAASRPPQPESAALPAAPVTPSPTAVERPAAIEIEAHDRVLDAVVAVPLELGDDGIEIQTAQGQKKLVRYQRIEAVAVAAVHGIGPRPVILVDLVLNWTTPTHEMLRVIRIRGDQFDPRRLFSGHASAVDALRSFVKIVLERSGATPLPDADTALGRPFASFEELAIYQRAILMVEGPAQPARSDAHGRNA